MSKDEMAAGLLCNLRKAEAFVSGFEDDETQDGINELLGNLRSAIATLSSDAVAGGGPVAWRTELSYGFAHTSNLNQANEWANWGYVQPLYAAPPETAQLPERVKELEKAVEKKDEALDAIIAAFAVTYLGSHKPSAVETEVIELARTARRVREGGKVDG